MRRQISYQHRPISWDNRLGLHRRCFCVFRSLRGIRRRLLRRRIFGVAGYRRREFLASLARLSAYLPRGLLPRWHPEHPPPSWEIQKIRNRHSAATVSSYSLQEQYYRRGLENCLKVGWGKPARASIGASRCRRNAVTSLARLMKHSPPSRLAVVSRKNNEV